MKKITTHSKSGLFLMEMIFVLLFLGLISVGLTVIRSPLALVLSNTALGLNGIWWALTLSTVSKGIIFYFVFQYICEHSLLRTTNR